MKKAKNRKMKKEIRFHIYITKVSQNNKIKTTTPATILRVSRGRSEHTLEAQAR